MVPCLPRMTLRIRRRTRLRRKEASGWVTRLSADFGMDLDVDLAAVDGADAGDRRLLLLGGDVIAFLHGDDIAPTLRSLLVHPARRRHVTVDMGAVPFIYNGADVMSPGIVAADEGIRAGDLVWVRDEKHGKPLAVGVALLDGPAMARKEKGKAIETVHHVGDDIWRLPEEAA